MPRYKLTLEYDGTGFHGWQRQTGYPSVQETLECAITAFCGQEVQTHAAGRTDAGVHACGQVVHMDLPRSYDPFAVRQGINFHLGREPAVVVLEAEATHDDFHARFSATARHYLYRIVNRRPPLTLERHRAWQIPVDLDSGAMQEAAQLLIGTHDFTSFRDTECQAKSPVKTLDRLDVHRSGEEILITARSRSFLHHQMRIITGTLTLVGRGQWTADDVARALAARERAAGGPTAPAYGLYLTQVDY